ncbi:hypothetical protein DYBT9275_02375 [Dyadobacter sp. CECT 9275]|uniref:Uncharacterized protein n=2 Tax=Dyadobacter helix TaxID=2822344 RepID=A0A916NBT5_9BACT|nr:hypothetical protein DYBT9275_02375 [Dyadobacter sp. CECT 9275]
MVLADELPPIFQPAVFGHDIPVAITYGEHISRIILFGLMFLMPLRMATVRQKAGLAIYFLGMLLYFSSWLMLICLPDSPWSKSAPGFIAPAFTPLLWLTGIGLAGDRPFFRFPYLQYIYILIMVLFLVCHNLHTWLIYSRIE